MSQVYALLTASNFVGTPYELQFCIKNLEDRLDRLVRIQGVKIENTICLREDYDNGNISAALVALGKRAVKGDAILWFDASHGTDCDTPNGVVQSVCTKAFNFDDPSTWITAEWLEATMHEASPDADWYLELDACMTGGIVREEWEPGCAGAMAAMRQVFAAQHARYMPHPDGSTPSHTARSLGHAIRDIVPSVRAACLTAVQSNETAIDADADGFTGQLCQVLDGQGPTLRYTPALLADAVGKRLDPSYHMHPDATGLLIDLPLQR